MKKVNASVKDLVRKLAKARTLLPKMQRRYVWQAPWVRDLLDSLYRA